MLPPPPKSQRLFVEPLESRIAPTNLVGLANDPTDPQVVADGRYITYTTIPGSGKLGFVPGSTYGVANGASGKVYALKLSGDGTVDAGGHSTGDALVIFNSATGFNFNSPFLQATNGSLIAFFQDKNGDNQVQTNELTGIALAKKVSANINGNVNGDIVTNLNSDGSISLTSAGKAGRAVGGLNIVGNVETVDAMGNVSGGASILSGGSIANINITGSVLKLHAGSAVAGDVFHFGDPAVPTGTLTAAPIKADRVGPSIDAASMLAVGSIHAGNGGSFAMGGSVDSITLTSDTNGFSILSGNGGNGDLTHKAGAGGDISNVLVRGVPDTTANNVMLFQAGAGGADSAFKGGPGGTVSGIATSFDAFNPATGAQQVSADILLNNIVVHGGDGGDGLRGGRGGTVTNSLFFGAAPDDHSIQADGTANAEIQIFGGNGGAGVDEDNGHGGKGGGVLQVTAENVNATTDALTSSILLHGGDGGAGKRGGDVSGITLLGAEIALVGGNGGNGVAKGGFGGALDTITVLNNTQIFASAVTLDAGVGGTASKGTGGNGGDVAIIRIGDSHLESLIINDGTHANAGAGLGGLGGAGGLLNDVQITDSGPLPATPAVAAIRTGNGGGGTAGGGSGGDITGVQMLATDIGFTVTAGNGGGLIGNGRGRGGAGGTLTSVGISNETFDTSLGQFAANGTGAVHAGNGGDGTRGGSGGSLVSVDLRVAQGVVMTAGDGGRGTTRKTGAGGDIMNSAGSSLLQSVQAISGSAGTAGGKAAKGGDINAFIAAAGTSIEMISGNGSVGGAGGSILNSGTSVDELSQISNNGAVTITAGNGSSANGIAGAGGSITVFNGAVGRVGTTAFTAGNGGGGTGATASGAGGGIDQVTLTGSGPGALPEAPLQAFVTLDGGSAGAAEKAETGAAGGSVSNVTISGLPIGTLVQHLAAGDGSGGGTQGGAGGSVTGVHVGDAGETTADIGFRSGVTYGYALGTGAGGLFAGVGGTGKTAGLPGSVTDITARAIASIAAGKGDTPQLALTVDAINLEGSVPTAVNLIGGFTNFDTANLVGSIVDPTAKGASTFKKGDGLIAAANITSLRNFFPEAELTEDSTGKIVRLVDYRQPNPVPAMNSSPFPVIIVPHP